MTKEEIIQGLYKGDSKAIREAIKALEQEPRKITLEDVKGYCKPRCLTVIANEVLCKLTHPKIKALEQEPCEDCVSREAVFETIDDCNSDGLKGIFCSYDDGERFKEYIKKLPPVAPTTCIAKVVFDKDDLQKMVDEKVKELVTHGTCKDCSRKRLDKEEREEVGAEKYFCPVVCGYVDETPDFYCEKFEKGGSEDD